MKLKLHPGLQAELLQQQLQRFRIIGEAFGTGAAPSIPRVEFGAEFGGKTRFVEVEEITQQARGPHPAQAAAPFKEAYLGAGFDEYVSKPIVDERILLRAIERCLARLP